MSALDRAVLRAEVGEQNFESLEAICLRLDDLESRQIISPEGGERIFLALAEELASQSLARKLARDSLVANLWGRS